MSTESLRRDHDAIASVVKSMQAAAGLLRSGTQVPEPILMQVVDFTKNFADACHHSKEEESLFPALAESGMPTNMGPIAVMLMEHEKSRKIGARMEESARAYLASNDSAQLVADMDEYAAHMTEHLWKENNRLFVMADARLAGSKEQVGAQLHKVEGAKLAELGRDRAHYEKIAKDLAHYAESG